MNNNHSRKYGFNVYDQQPEDQFEYASSNGLHHIEINLSKKFISIETFNANRINKLKTLTKAHNIKLSFHIPFHINVSEAFLPLRKFNINHLLKCIQVASELNATHVTLHVGKFFWFPVEAWMRKKALKRFVRSLREVLMTCEDKNVIIAIENLAPIPNGSEYYLLGDNVEDFKYIFSQLDSEYLKFCLDTGHANMAEGVLEYITSFHDKLNCIHYHDNNGFNDEHLAIGEGKVPWKILAEKLTSIKYQGAIISECRNIKAHEAATLFENNFDKNSTIIK